MKYKLFFILMLLPFAFKAQGEYDELISRYSRTSKTFDSLRIRSITIINMEDALKDLKPTYNKLEKLKDFSKKELQLALLKDYFDRYYDFFSYTKNGKKGNFLVYGFEDVESMREFSTIAYYFLMNNIAEEKSKLIIERFEADNKRIENYINENLNRLGITRQYYDNMSKSDKELLINEFK